MRRFESFILRHLFFLTFPLKQVIIIYKQSERYRKMREIKATVGFAYTHKEVEDMIGKPINNFIKDFDLREQVYDHLESIHKGTIEILYYDDEIKVLID